MTYRFIHCSTSVKFRAMVNSISLVFIFVEGDISLPTLALLNSPKWKIKCQKITRYRYLKQWLGYCKPSYILHHVVFAFGNEGVQKPFCTQQCELVVSDGHKLGSSHL